MLCVGVPHAAIHLIEVSPKRAELRPGKQLICADVAVRWHIHDFWLGDMRHGECDGFSTLVVDSTVVDKHVAPGRCTPQTYALVSAKCQQMEAVRCEAQAIYVTIVCRVY